MKLTWHATSLVLREPLRISRAVTSGRDAFTLRLTDASPGSGLAAGHGEVVASAYQRLESTRIVRLLGALAGWVAERPDAAALSAQLPELSDVPGALLYDVPGMAAALDAAALDLLGHQTGQPVHALLGEDAPEPVATAYTIGITAPERAAATARRLVARGFTVLKVKAGAADPEEDIARVAAVRAAAPAARILLDPNGAWTPEQAVALIDRMAPFRLDAVEQPIPPGTADRLAWIAARCPVPLIADEDAAGPEDVPRLAGAVRGVNIKLPKCGGVRPALRTAELAREHGLDIMLGCLVASSLGVVPAVHLTARARWVDLDGHLLLARDPWAGIGGQDGVLRPPGGPGLGVRPAVGAVR